MGRRSLGLILITTALLASDATAQERVILRDIVGHTNQGTRYEGVAMGEDGKVVARLSITGIERKQRFTATLPAGKKLVGIRLDETPRTNDSVGAAGRLRGERGGDAPLAEKNRFTLVPLVESDLTLTIVNLDGSELDLEREWRIAEKFEAKAHLTAGTAAITTAQITWRVPGKQLHDYALTIEKDAKGNDLEMIHGRKGKATAKEQYEDMFTLSQTPLAREHMQSQTLSLYWVTEGNGEAKIRATADVVYDGVAERVTAEVAVKVRRDDNPARHCFTKGTLPGGIPILPNHAGWHSAYRGSDKFIMFHREFLRVYNAWRQMFGYLKIMQEYDPTKPAYGEDLANYTYLTPEGGEEGSYTHGAKKLSDFENVSDLGDDLEHPFHNRGHMTISRHGGQMSDMASVSNAPRCEQFFRWHTKVDNVALDYEDLKAEEAATARDVAKDIGPAKDLAEREDDPDFGDLTGFYNVTGKLPSGAAYRGNATVTKTGKNLYLIQGMGAIENSADGSGGNILWKASARRNSPTEVEVIHHTNTKGIAGRAGVTGAIQGKYTAYERSKQFGGTWEADGKQGEAVYQPGPMPTVTFTPSQVTIRGGEVVEVEVKVTPPEAMSLVWVEDTGWMTFKVKKNREAGVKTAHLEGGGSGFFKLLARLGKDASGPVLGEIPVRVDPMLTDVVLRKVQDLSANSLRPIVVFDLDNTLFDTRHRTKALIEEFGQTNNESRMRSVPLTKVRYTLNDTLRQLGYSSHEVSNAGVVRDLRTFVNGKLAAGFFDADQAEPASVSYLSKLQAGGAEIVYIADRPSSQSDATERAIRAAGFPTGRVIYKDRSGSVSKWKADQIARLQGEGTLVAAFDNEPREANAIRKALPASVEVIQPKTRIKPNSPKTDEGVGKVRTF